MDYIERECDFLIPLEGLELSTRAFNSLRRAGILNFRDFMQLSEASLSDIHSLGAKTIEEILSAQEKYAAEPPPQPVTDFTKDGALGVFEHDGLYYRNFTLSELGVSTRAQKSLKAAGIVDLQGLSKLNRRELSSLPNLGKVSVKELTSIIAVNTDPLSALNYSNGEMEQGRELLGEIRDRISSFMRSDVYSEHTAKEIYAAMDSICSQAEMERVLEKMVAAGQLAVDKKSYSLPLRSFRELLSEFPNEHQQYIFGQRLHGVTLEQIAGENQLTRERIRQIEKRVLNFLRREGPSSEDRYAYLFTNYDIDRQTFCRITDEEPDVYTYLELMYRQREPKALALAADDENVLPVLRSRIHRVYGGYITIDGEKVKLTRISVEKFIIRKYCTEDTKFDDFFKMYRKFISENGLDEHKHLAVTDGMYRTFENYVSQCHLVLWKQNRKFRYYDIDGTDPTALLEALDLSRYHDVHYSSLKFFRMYPELMKDYDLRDEYELHNFLRKVGKYDKSYINFNKMPMIEFGKFDRDKAVQELMFRLAPISIDELADVMFEEYGIRQTTVKSNWFASISCYYVNGKYITDSKPLPPEHTELLKKALKEDFYYLDELKALYKKLCPDADTELLGGYNLRQMGFMVNSTYVISGKYNSAKDYFTSVLSSKERIDITEISRRYAGIVSYSDNLAKLKDNYTVVEYEPYHLIHHKGLQKSGITLKKIKAFCQAVYDFTGDELFTVENLYARGFTSELDDCEFSNWFFSSLLREDGRFNYQKIGRTVMFIKGNKSINRAQFIRDFIDTHPGKTVDELRFSIFTTYGIDVSRYDISASMDGGE